MKIQQSISEVLRVEYDVALPVIQIGSFWQATGAASEALAQLLGISTYRFRGGEVSYCGFPVTAEILLQEIRNQTNSWALISQVGRQGSLVIRRCIDSSEPRALDLEFRGSKRFDENHTLK